MPPVFPWILQAASLDKTALKELSMDRTTTSYKLREGLAPYLQEDLLVELQSSPFSLNIDEATSKTNDKVLEVLVSHFSPSRKRVMMHHLDAIVLTQSSAGALFEELDKLFKKHSLNWDNVVSVLMDSCNVMRGAKGGLEALIRKRVPTLLDIDGDTCHHAHNSAKVFCGPFEGLVEGLMRDLHIDFKWSQDLKDKLFDICHILGIKATSPERYVPHRWLSVLEVSLDTVRLIDAYSVFYYSFLNQNDTSLHSDIVEDILKKREVSDKGKEKIKELQTYLRQKFKSFTQEGKERKVRVADKCFSLRIDTLATLHIYCSILPYLQKYVLFFQRKEPAMHRLHDKQHDLFNEFCANFLTPECLKNKMPHQVDIQEEKNHKKDMFFPVKAAELLATKEGMSHKKQFVHKLKKAYVACALSLQRKMPVNNPILKACAALDWTVRETSTAQRHLKALAKLTVTIVQDKKKMEKHVLVDPVDQEDFEKEVASYTASPSIPTPAPGTRIDEYWSQIDSDRYPLLTSIAQKLLSAFHGPAVEASFSTMGEILHAGASRMDIATYSAIQSVRYFMAANNTTAVQFFSKKDPTTEPIPKKLTQKMQKSWELNNERKVKNREADIKKKVSLGAPVAKPATKTAEKARIILEEGQKKPEKTGKKGAEKVGHSTSVKIGQKRPASHTASKEPERKKQKLTEPDSEKDNPDSPSASHTSSTPSQKSKSGDIRSFFKFKTP